MATQGLFAKEVYIRLDDRGTGFFCTVKYGRLSLPARRIQVFEDGESIQRVEAPPVKTPDRSPYPVRPAPAGEAKLGARESRTR
jgi:hypothetical protein